MWGFRVKGPGFVTVGVVDEFVGIPVGQLPCRTSRVGRNLFSELDAADKFGAESCCEH